MPDYNIYYLHNIIICIKINTVVRKSSSDLVIISLFEGFFKRISIEIVNSFVLDFIVKLFNLENGLYVKESKLNKFHEFENF